MNTGNILAETLQMATRGALRSMEHIIEIEGQIEAFRPRISSTTETVLTAFLDNSNSAAQMAFDIAALLALKIDFSERVERNKDLQEKGVTLNSLGLMSDYHEFGLLIVTTFRMSIELHNLLAGLADQPTRNRNDVAKEVLLAGLGYFKGLGKRLALVEEVEEVLALLEEIDQSANRLKNSHIKITLQHLADLDSDISTFAETAQSIAKLRDVQLILFKEVEDFATRVNSNSGV